MNFMQIVTLIEDAYTELQALKADGTFDKVKAAEAALLTEIADPKVQALLTKLRVLKV